jgi:hypothetical protein
MCGGDEKCVFRLSRGAVENSVLLVHCARALGVCFVTFWDLIVASFSAVDPFRSYVHPRPTV